MTDASAVARALLDALPRALSPKHGVARLLEIASELPQSRGGVSLECHLASPDRHVDLVMRIHREDRDRILDSGSKLAPSVAAFLRAWRDPARGLDHVPYVDLEYDVRDRRLPPFIGPMIDPYLSEGVQGLVEARERGAVQSHPPPSSYAVAERVVRAFDAPPPSAGALRQMDRCYAALPPEGFICHLTSLTTRLSKPEDAIRLIVSLPIEDLWDYMKRIGHPRDGAAVQRRVSRYLNGSSRVDFDLDIDARGPRPTFSTYITLARRLDESLVADALEPFGRQGAAAVRKLSSWLSWEPPAGAPPRSLTVKVGFMDNRKSRLKAYLSLLRPLEPRDRLPRESRLVGKRAPARVHAHRARSGE